MRAQALLPLFLLRRPSTSTCDITRNSCRRTRSNAACTDVMDANDIVLERPDPVGAVFEVRTRAGKLLFSQGKASGEHALALDQRLFIGEDELSWTGERGATFGPGAGGSGGEQLACSVTGGNVQMLAAKRSRPPRHGYPYYPDYTRIETARLEGPNSATRLAWVFQADEPGVGAIDGANHTILALPSGRLVVLLPEGDEKLHAIRALDAPVDPNATDLSVVPPFAMLLYGGGDAGELAARRSASFATSRLDARRPDGSLAWRASVDFLAEQPPVDGGDRVYLVGKGIAAFDLEGHRLWSSPSTLTLRAAAFADGTLALVRGNELQVVAKDGSIKQSFRASEDLTSYPSIAADGSIWLASEKTLYVAR
jgi:hypothetical protein